MKILHFFKLNKPLLLKHAVHKDFHGHPMSLQWCQELATSGPIIRNGEGTINNTVQPKESS